MIKSFLPSATVFTSNGERIIQAIKCIEHRELGDWYVDLIAPLEYQSYLEKDYILVVPTKEKGDQPFRINNPKITDKVDVRAYHIGFDTRNYAVELSTVVNGNAQTCLNTLSSEIDGSHPFTFTSAIATLKSFSVVDSSLYNALIQIADEYNGVLDFNGWNITISSSIGADNGVVLAYGKNIQESEINENWDLVVTRLKPIGNDGITLTPAWLTADVSYDRPYTKIMNFDSDNTTNLALVAQLYLDRYKVPRVNYKVKADVEQNVALGDAVTVNARQFTTTAEVLSFDYNPLINRVIQVEFGNFRPTLKQFFSDQAQVIEESAYKKARLKIDEAAGVIEAYADNLISLAVGTAIKGQDSILPYTQDVYERGTISSATGVNEASAIRLRLIDHIIVSPSVDYVIQVSTGFQMWLYWYQSDGTFISSSSAWISTTNTKVTSPSNAGRLRVAIGKSSNAQLDLIELPNYSARFSPVGQYLKGSKFNLDDTGAQFYGDGFKIYNSVAVLKAFFDNVLDHLNLGISIAMQKVQPADITELVQLNNGKHGIKFGDDRNSFGFPYAFLSVFDSGNLVGLTQAFNAVLYANNSVEIRSDGLGDGIGNIRLIAANEITMQGIANVGNVVHITFGGTKYLITRDANGFLKATTTV
jgi:phage minor structural protein